MRRGKEEYGLLRKMQIVPFSLENYCGQFDKKKYVVDKSLYARMKF